MVQQEIIDRSRRIDQHAAAIPAFPTEWLTDRIAREHERGHPGLGKQVGQGAIASWKAIEVDDRSTPGGQPVQQEGDRR